MNENYVIVCYTNLTAGNFATKSQNNIKVKLKTAIVRQQVDPRMFCLSFVNSSLVSKF